MKLPNSEKAWIAEQKLKLYLLSTTHPVGAAKARFFRKFGYNDHNTDLLKHGLLRIARLQEITQMMETHFGRKYVIDGELHTPIGRPAAIRTVWILEPGDENPRLVTAHPR